MSEGAYADESDALERSIGYAAPEVDELLQRLRHFIDAARPMPLSVSSMINKEEVLEMIDEISTKMPDELRAARWLLKEREEFLAKVRREGDEILAQARAGSERMVQRTEVVKAAEARARQIVDGADAEARRLKHEAEDYCDQKLGSFEIALERTLGVVAAGRAKLQGNPLADLASPNPASPAPGPAPAPRPGPAPAPQRQAAPDPQTMRLQQVAPPPLGALGEQPPATDEFGAPVFFDQEVD